MKKQLRTGLLAVGAAATAVLTAFCGGGTGTSGSQTTIDETGVERGVELASSVISICHNGAGLRSSVINPTVPGGAAWLGQLLGPRRQRGPGPSAGPAGAGPPPRPPATPTEPRRERSGSKTIAPLMMTPASATS